MAKKDDTIVVGQIYQTSNYESFKLICSNRDIKDHHVRRLARSMKKLGFFKGEPILVNEKREILNGQHRYLAAQQVGIPVVFKIEEGASPAIMRATGTNRLNWTMDDYLKHFCEVEPIEDYKLFREFMTTNAYTYKQAECFHRTNIGLEAFKHEFREGMFVYQKNCTWQSNVYKSLRERLSTEKRSIKRLVECARFISSLVILLNHPRIELDRFWQQLESYRGVLKPQISKKETINMLFDFYNYKRKDRITQEAATADDE